MIWNNLVNVIGFQAVWFLSLLGAGSQIPWLGTVALAVFTVWHFRSTGTPKADLVLVGVAAVVGFVADTAFIRAHLLAYAEPLPFATAAPFWILVMWMNFALTLNGSLRWLHGRYVLAAALGAIGGPLAYLAGFKLGAAEMLADGALVMAALAFVWAGAVPLLVLTAARANRAWPPRAAVSS